MNEPTVGDYSVGQSDAPFVEGFQYTVLDADGKTRAWCDTHGLAQELASHMSGECVPLDTPNEVGEDESVSIVQQGVLRLIGMIGRNVNNRGGGGFATEALDALTTMYTDMGVMLTTATLVATLDAVADIMATMAQYSTPDAPWLPGASEGLAGAGSGGLQG